MDPQNLTLTIAFLAGLLSFASPCVLPLVPAYMGYLGGTAVIAGEQAGARRDTVRTFLHPLAFWLLDISTIKSIYMSCNRSKALSSGNFLALIRDCITA